MFFLWIFTLCWVIDCHCEQVGFSPALAIKGNVLNECTVRPLNWWTHPKRYSLFLDTLQEPGSAKCAGRRRMGRNCCTRKLIRSNVDMQSQLEGPEISSNKDCKLAVIWILLVCLREIPICVNIQVISNVLLGNYAAKKTNEMKLLPQLSVWNITLQALSDTTTLVQIVLIAKKPQKTCK